MNKLKRLFENWVFKKRYVFYIDNKLINYNTLPKSKKDIRIDFFDFKANSKNQLYEILKQIVPPFQLKRYTNRYDYHKHWKALFLYKNLLKLIIILPQITIMLNLTY